MKITAPKPGILQKRGEQMQTEHLHDNGQEWMAFCTCNFHTSIWQKKLPHPKWKPKTPRHISTAQMQFKLSQPEKDRTLICVFQEGTTTAAPEWERNSLVMFPSLPSHGQCGRTRQTHLAVMGPHLSLQSKHTTVTVLPNLFAVAPNLVRCSSPTSAAASYCFLNTLRHQWGSEFLMHGISSW